MGTLQDEVFASLDAEDAATRDVLRQEAQQFIAHMRTRGLPGIERIKITIGYKSWLRHPFTPKYERQIYDNVAGWVLRFKDIKKFQDDKKLSGFDMFVFGITLDGDLLYERCQEGTALSPMTFDVMRQRPIDMLPIPVIQKNRYCIEELLKIHG